MLHVLAINSTPGERTGVFPSAGKISVISDALRCGVVRGIEKNGVDILSSGIRRHMEYHVPGYR